MSGCPYMAATRKQFCADTEKPVSLIPRGKKTRSLRKSCRGRPERTSIRWARIVSFVPFSGETPRGRRGCDPNTCPKGGPVTRSAGVTLYLKRQVQRQLQETRAADRVLDVTEAALRNRKG